MLAARDQLAAPRIEAESGLIAAQEAEASSAMQRELEEVRAAYREADVLHPTSYILHPTSYVLRPTYDEQQNP